MSIAAPYGCRHGARLGIAVAVDILVEDLRLLAAGRRSAGHGAVGPATTIVTGFGGEEPVITSELHPLLQVKGDRHAAERLHRLVPDPGGRRD